MSNVHNHEWSPADEAAAVEAGFTLDANGNVLADGDTVIVMKDLNAKNSGSC